MTTPDSLTTDPASGMIRKARLPRAAARRAATTLALVAIALTGGYIGGKLGASTGLGVRREEVGGWFFVALVAVLWITIAVHELGHLLAGLWQGNRFALYAVGPLLVVREGERVRIRFNRNISLWGGIAGTMPLPTAEAARALANFQRVVIAGPLASLLLAGFGALVASTTDGATRLLAFTAALTSGLIALVTLVPLRTGGFHSDGARWLMLRRGGVEAERWAALSTLGALAMHAVSPAEWPSEVVARAERLADDSLDGTLLHQMLHGAALLRGDGSAAARHMAALRTGGEAMPSTIRQLIALDSAWYAAMVEGDAARARADFEEGKRAAFASPRTRQRVEAAVLLAEGRREEGRTLALRLRDEVRSATGLERLEVPYVEALAERLGRQV